MFPSKFTQFFLMSQILVNIFSYDLRKHSGVPGLVEEATVGKLCLADVVSS